MNSSYLFDTNLGYKECRDDFHGVSFEKEGIEAIGANPNQALLTSHISSATPSLIAQGNGSKQQKPTSRKSPSFLQFSLSFGIPTTQNTQRIPTTIRPPFLFFLLRFISSLYLGKCLLNYLYHRDNFCPRFTFD